MPSGANAGSSSGGGAPTGNAGGDLSGTYPNPTVANLNGTAAASYALLAGPTFTGVVTLPTGTVGTTQTAANNSTRLATTAYTDTADNLKANLAGPTFTGVVTLPTGTVATTQSASDNSTKLGTTAYIDTADALKANLASPTFTGTPVVPTGTTGTSQTVLDRSTKLSTTLYTDRAIENSLNGMGWSAPTNSVAVSFDRAQAPQGTRTVVTAVIYMTAIYIPIGTVVSNFNCISGTTASSCTHSWCALFNNSRVQLAATADDVTGNASFTADTTRTQAVATIASGASATFTTTYTGLHYVGITVVFTGTAPTMRCDASGNTILNALAPIMTGTSNTTQTTPNAFAFTANALTATSNRDYVWLT